jgi:Protein of unknown function (DUF3592)
MTGFFVAAVPLLLGGLFGGAAALLAFPVLRMVKTWGRTTGTIVDLEEFESGGETVRRLELRFRDGAGREWKTTSPIAWKTAEYRKGAELPILFDPENPSTVRVERFAEIWLMPAIVGASGAIAVLLGFGFAIALSR